MINVQAIPDYWRRLLNSDAVPARLRQWIQKSPKLFAAAGLVLLLLLIIVLGRSCTRTQQGALSFHTVKRGDFLVSIVEGGSLRAVNEVIVRCELEGTSHIISIAPEGTTVKKGDLLVELDSSELQDKLSQQEIAYENFKFAFVQAEQNLSIQKSLVESNLKEAELKVQFAESDLEKYVEGDWPQQKKVAETKITIIQEELQRGQDRYEWTVELNKKGYATKTELEADSLVVKRKQIEFEQTQEELRLLIKYDFPKRKTLMASNAEQAKMDLDRLKQRSASQMAQAEADLETRKRSLELHGTRLAQLKEQLELTKLRAPQDGLVVYASSGNSNYLVEEGATVRQRQELIKLPDISSMLVDVRIHESFVNQINPGLLAYVTIDSLPERRFVGSVRRIAPLPDTQSRYMNPNLKVYSTEVVIEEEIPDLKPGVSAHVEIVITNLANVVSIPIQAVTTLKGKQVVYLANTSEPALVEVGHNNDRFIEIKAGLKEGQQVLLSPPISNDSQDLVGSMVSSEEIEAAKNLLRKTNEHGVAKGSVSGRGTGRSEPKPPPKSPKKEKPVKPAKSVPAGSQ